MIHSSKELVVDMIDIWSSKVGLRLSFRVNRPEDPILL
jgi:hypothetical protein